MTTAPTATPLPTIRPARPLLSRGPLGVFGVLLEHWSLVRRLASREIAQQYRGSWLGPVWVLLTPLLILLAYTLVFSVVFEARWGGAVSTEADSSRAAFAVILFGGLIVFQMFADSISAAPGGILAQTTLVKKVVFPLETLAWVTVLRTGFGAVCSLLILGVLYVPVMGAPPWTVVLLPVMLMPVVLMTLGFVWFLSATGVFVRDLNHVVGVFTTLVLFLSAIFYPVSAVPEWLQPLLYLSPLTVAVEQTRQVVFLGEIPSVWLYLLYTGASWAIAWAGLSWFRYTSRGFADVL